MISPPYPKPSSRLQRVAFPVLLIFALTSPIACKRSRVESQTQAMGNKDAGSSPTSPLPAPTITILGELHHKTMRSASRIAVAPNGDIVVTDPLGRAVHIFSAQGTWKRAITGIERPLGCAVDKAGRIYVGDHATRSVLVFNALGKRLGTLGGKAGTLRMPNELTYDSDHDELYVVDSKANQVVVFSTSGEKRRTLGGPAAGQATLSFPTGIHCDAAHDRVYVADHQNARIQVFNRQGQWLSSFGSYGTNPGQILRPQGLVLDKKLRLYIVEAFQGRLQVLDTKGAFIAYVGAYGRTAGHLALPSDAVVDTNQRLLVTSFRTAKVVIYSIDGATFPDLGVDTSPSVDVGTQDHGAAPSDLGTQDQAPADAGSPKDAAASHDQGSSHDANPKDGAATSSDQRPHADATSPAPTGGCGCVIASDTHPFAATLFGLVLLVVLRDARRHQKRRSTRVRSSFLLTLLFVLAVASAAAALAPPHDPTRLPNVCQSCHVSHSSFGSLLSTANGEAIDNLCQSCHYANGPATAVETHSCDTATDPLCGHTFSIPCTTCHNPHKQEQDDVNGTTYGKLLRATVKTPSGSTVPVILQGIAGPKSLADDDTTIDGFCEICHTTTTHHTDDPAKGDADHYPRMPCTSCHWHSASFKPRHLSAGHAVHIDANTRCPKLDCGACHDVEDVPNFKSGDDANGDGKYNLAETDVCNTCHSPGGSYNGVNADSRSVGAKNEWFTGVYTGDTLQPGKEKWCAGCHDESPSTINGVSAPNVIGNESASTGYGIGYGFYKTGHGLEGGIYPTSGAPAAKLTCAACHDFSTTHIDGDARTYVAASNNYQAGYRLKSVNGGRPMNIPRSGNTTPASDFAICMQCHESAPRIDSGNMQTNFRETVGSTHNSHAYHLNGAFTNKWDSDWDGSTAESRQSCPACHNVHGSPSMAMGRHGELISTPGTTDKVPALDYRYTPGSFPTLAESTGGEMAFRGRGNVAESGVCVMCHRGTGYTRTPIDLYPPTILGAYAKTLGTQVHVIFSEAVYTSPSQTGAIIPGDLTLTDIDNGRTIIAVSHSAGDSRGTLTLSSALDAVDDIDVDTLAAASTTSIYDGADLAMNIGTVTIEADDDGPDASNLFPANGATFVSGFTPLTFTLTDPKSNVDWSTFSVTITGTAYNKTYTDLDTTVVSKTGPASAYAVTIIPDQSFPCSTTMTVVLHANDYLGNAMISPAWTFDTIPWANLPPVLSWTRELVAYNIDGVKPSHGEINTSFTFRVKYTDLDNNAPTVMTLWIDGSSYTMSEADSGDQTFTDGKIYTRTLTLGTAGTFAYHFSASDGTDAATGEPTSNTDVEVITAAHALNVPSEYATISAAVTAVSDVDDTILVAAGTYTGQVYISKEVQLRSLDDAENTILTNIDNREVFFNHAKASTLDGFTLDGQNGVGRGIYSENDSWPTILNCIIVRHHGDHGLVVGGANTVSVINTTFSDNIGGSGGAIYGNNNGTHIIATYCTFDNNAATSIRGGAVFLNTGVDGTFTRCTFNNNTAPSAGAIGTSSTSIVTIVGCTFTNNTATTGGGGAIYLNSTGQISIETSVFTGNEAVSGAAITLNMHTTMTMTNCTLTGNNASTYAGAIYFNTTDSTTIHSCTFSGNEANLGGALYFINGGTKTITNSIFYGDWSRNSNENEIMTNGAAYPTVTYCNISQTDFIGDNNFPDDPLFLDPKSHTLAPTSTGDYHVNPVSPCLEKGTSTNAPTTDIDGETRPQNGGYDVGSDEKVLPPC